MSKKLPAPSEEFLSAIKHSISKVINCEHCDRVHFTDSNSFDWEEGELESLLKFHKQNPDKFILHLGDGVEWGYLAGKQYVLDCPCSKASVYENLYWGDRYLIESYFELRAKKKSDEAREAKKLSLNLKRSMIFL